MAQQMKSVKPSCNGKSRFETMGGALEEVPCLLCKSTSWTDYDTENGYRLVKCSDCGLLFTNPRPSSSEIDAASKSGMHKGDEELEVSGEFRPFMKEIYLSVLNDFQYPAKFASDAPVDWLDIGCGHREFVEALNIVGGEGIAVTGLEPNEHKRAAAKTRGMDLVFFDTTEHDRTYDVISALNVFSHLPDPREDIGQWISMLNEGGELFLQTGDSSHLEVKHHHKPYSLPDHLSFASETLLVAMLESLGLEVVQVMKYRMGMFPRFTPVNIVKEIARFFLPGHTATFQFFPKHPERDMYIRARKPVKK